MSQISEALTSQAGRLPLVASELAFDFANTHSNRGGPNDREYLLSPAHLLVWARHAKILTDHDRDSALARVEREPDVGDKVLRDAICLRETIYRIATAIVARREPTAVDREALAAAYATALAKAHLAPSPGGFVWAWDPAEALGESFLGPIALSALTILTQQNLARIKQCQGDHCGWVFYDATKNRSRRWCEMEVCGNRAKVRKHRTKLKAEDVTILSAK